MNPLHVEAHIESDKIRQEHNNKVRAEYEDPNETLIEYINKQYKTWQPTFSPIWITPNTYRPKQKERNE